MGVQEESDGVDAATLDFGSPGQARGYELSLLYKKRACVPMEPRRDDGGSGCTCVDYCESEFLFCSL